MAKLYFKYGVMGASKSAHALITKYNYEQGGNKVLLIKPIIDDRDGADIIRSRIGLESRAEVVCNESDLNSLMMWYQPDVIICDEAQFFTPNIIDALHHIAAFDDKPVICYGLLTDFQTHLFPGSKRLIEVAESIKELQMVCRCKGCTKKATINARLVNGKIVTEGEQVVLGGDETYQAMCFECYCRKIAEQEE